MIDGTKKSGITVGTKIRWIAHPWGDSTYEDGWFGGILDGEGSISNGNRKGVQVSASQLRGPVFDRMVAYAKSTGFAFGIENDLTQRLTKYGKSPVPRLAFTRMAEVFELIGKTRPTRMLAKRFWEGRELPGKRVGTGWATVTSIEPLPEQEVIDVQTSTGTFIAEGFVSHNSTIMLVLDLFWLYVNPGLQGAMIADTADNRENFRKQIGDIMDSLPKGWRIPVIAHNRNELRLSNGSVLQYMSAGKGKNSGLGRSRALSYTHATETSSWGDQKGIDSLRAALAQVNPNRLFCFESTALGYNVFYDMWNEAKASPTQIAIFIGWWAKDSYMHAEGSAEYDHWWAIHPVLSEYEAETAHAVKVQYDWDITSEQWAWYREVSSQRSHESMMEDYPATEHEAFVASGHTFFNVVRLNTDIQFITESRSSFHGWNYTLGANFLDMKMEPANNVEALDLRVWEKPKAGAVYVIGVDPAYGRSADADRSVISVWRCFADKLVQVAEYATPIPDSRQVAWVMAHLASEYRDCIINLEIQGGGSQVMQELNSLKQLLQWGHLKETARALKAEDCLDGAKWFLWNRPDSMGAGFAYGFKTGFDNKGLILNKFRDLYSNETVIVRSRHLLEEMLTLRQDGDRIAASGRNKDDRVMAAAFAIYAWDQWRRVAMMADNRTHERETLNQQRIESSTTDHVLGHIVPDFFANRAAQRAKAYYDSLDD